MYLYGRKRMRIEERVVARYARVVNAGLHKAPPAMLKAIQEWVASTYAGHVLAESERFLDSFSGKNFAGQIKEMEEAKERLTSDLKSLGDGEVARYKVYLPNGKTSWVGVKGTEYFRMPHGHIVVDPRDRTEGDRLYLIGGGMGRLTFPKAGPHQSVDADKAEKHVEQYLSSSIRLLNQASSDRATPLLHHEKAQIVELNLLRRECLKYSGGGKKYLAKANKKFPVDLRGWDYVPEGTKFTGWPDGVDVVLDFVGHTKSVGLWYPLRHQLIVDVVGGVTTSVRDFRENLEDILSTVRHESQHLGQTLLDDIKGLKGLTGRPSLKLRNVSEPGKPGSGRAPHALREEEFYTRISDEVDFFVARARKSVDPKTWKATFDDWVRKREFFKMLLEHEPQKWRKAVSEFLKGVNDRGFVF